MNQIQRTAQLRAEGLETGAIARMVRRGELERLRRDAYASPPESPLSAAEQHRRMIRATAPLLEPGAVVSHSSAAVLHGLPVWPEDLRHVHVTRSRGYGGKRRSVVSVHTATTGPDDIVMVDGVVVTSAVRTVLDLARRLPLERSVAAGDALLAGGVERDQLELGLVSMQHWPGVRRARRVVQLLDGRSESPGESVSRVRMLRDGVPAPQLQYEVFDEDGVLIARCDFGWPELGTVGEFDGKVKYGRLLKPGESIEDVVFREKQREDAVRDRHLQMVRWLWPDAHRPGVIRERLFRAFARGTNGRWHP